MSTFLASPNAPAWVQAIGSVVAILIAVLVPVWQRRGALRDASAERIRDEKEYLKRLVSALRAEVEAAMEAAEGQQSAAKRVVEGVERARHNGVLVKDDGPSIVVLTHAIVYRESAAEIGRLAASITSQIVTFYARALQIPHIAEAASSAEDSARTLLDLLPRVRISGVALLDALEQYERSDYARDVRFVPDMAKLTAEAAKIGYPIEEIAHQRGLRL